MRHTFKTATAAAALLAAASFVSPSAMAGSHMAAPGMIVKPSAYGVGETLDKLEGVLKKRGITVFARVDHAANAAKIGKEMPPTQLLIFGAPKIGTPLIQSNRTVGIDLPQKALVWQDEEGKVWLGYNKPGFLAKRHGISNRKKVFVKMGKALAKLTDTATQ